MRRAKYLFLGLILLASCIGFSSEESRQREIAIKELQAQSEREYDEKSERIYSYMSRMISQKTVWHPNSDAFKAFIYGKGSRPSSLCCYQAIMLAAIDAGVMSKRDAVKITEAGFYRGPQPSASQRKELRRKCLWNLYGELGCVGLKPLPSSFVPTEKVSLLCFLSRPLMDRTFSQESYKSKCLPAHLALLKGREVIEINFDTKVLRKVDIEEALKRCRISMFNREDGLCMLVPYIADLNNLLRSLEVD